MHPRTRAATHMRAGDWYAGMLQSCDALTMPRISMPRTSTRASMTHAHTHTHTHVHNEHALRAHTCAGDRHDHPHVSTHVYCTIYTCLYARAGDRHAGDLGPSARGAQHDRDAGARMRSRMTQRRTSRTDGHVLCAACQHSCTRLYARGHVHGWTHGSTDGRTDREARGMASYTADARLATIVAGGDGARTSARGDPVFCRRVGAVRLHNQGAGTRLALMCGWVCGARLRMHFHFRKRPASHRLHCSPHTP